MKGRLKLDSKNLNRANTDLEYRKVFSSYFPELLKNCSFVDLYIFKDVYKYEWFRKLIDENFSIVVSKTKDRINLMTFMTGAEIKSHLVDFFVKDQTNNSVSYKDLIIMLCNNGVSKNEIYSTLCTYIDDIVKDAGADLPYIINILHGGLAEHEKQKDEIISKIDKALVENLDCITRAKYIDGYFNFDHFDGMKEFKEKIKEQGVEFFYKFPIISEKSVKRYKDISEELFGKFSERNLAIMMFGYKNPESAQIIEIIIKELEEETNKNRANDSENQKKKITIDDFKELSEGMYSTAYQIGDYVLKIGNRRSDAKIPNHRRILQPILRAKINPYSNKDNNFIEVQNAVDGEWYKDMDWEDVKEILYDVYCDMRKSGIIWYDVKPENVGRLRKPNKVNFKYFDPYKNEEVDIFPTEEATGLQGELSEKEILKAGDYVVLDTDFIERYDNNAIDLDEADISRSSLQIEFEERYQKEKKEKEELHQEI